MANASNTHETLTEAEHIIQLRRALIASTIGTTIEWYDFFLYSTVTGLAFAKLYFPHDDPLTGTLEAFGIYAVGFAARPVGVAIFGHYGDRIGRKATLIATLLLMGIATFLVAFVPTYAEIGIWGAVILTALRFIQGVGVGGEWGGSVLLSMEWARTNGHRGFITSWAQFGVPAGLFLANLAVLASSAISGDRFLDWGWRTPFFLSIILVGIGLYIRLSVLETPTFRRLAIQNGIERSPTLEAIRRQQGKSFCPHWRARARRLRSISSPHSYSPMERRFSEPRAISSSSPFSRPRFSPFQQSLLRPSLRPNRTQTHVPARCRNNGSVRLPLFCSSKHGGARLRIFLAIVLSLIPARHDVRPASGADRGVPSRGGCAIAALRSAIILPRSSRVGPRRSSLPRFWRGITRAM